MVNFRKVAKIGDLKPSKSKAVDIDGESIALYNVDGKVYATSNICSHRGGPLAEGRLNGEIIACPWHGWCYNVRTGVCDDSDSVKIRTYPVRIEGDDVFVDIE